MSVLSLILCCSMLIGTTFAWFTDEVNSGANQILAGNLDVDVFYDNNGVEESIQGKDAALFENILWEPGAVAYENITVKNLGTLALKYALSVNFTNENTVKTDGVEYGLSTALKVAVVPGGVDTTLGRNELLEHIKNEAIKWNDLMELVETGVLHATVDCPVDGKTEQAYGIVIWWEPGEDDNNWNVSNGKIVSDYDAADPDSKNALHIDLGIKLAATQWTYEEDSYNHLYDEDAELPVYGVGSGENAVYDDIASAYEIPVYDADTDEQVGFINVPKVALSGDIKDVQATIAESEELYDGLGVVIGTDEKATTYNISVSGLKDGNTDDIKVGVKADSGYNQATIYHYSEEIAVVSYNDGDSYVEFLTDSFSPFTVVYSTVTEPTLNTTLPVAIVEDQNEFENVAIAWGSFGQWSPSDPAQQLEAAFKFTAPHNSETVEYSTYKNWYCDFYVKMDQYVPDGALFLGGNYGSFGWVGFENKGMPVEANVEVPLLGSVTSSPWTYEDVASFVGEFICGVARANGHGDELSGATFTVMLRLTNPDNEAEFYNVNTVTYTFP